MGYSDDRKIVNAVIEAGESLSLPVSLGGRSLVGIMPPATGSGDFDATTAFLLFHVGLDGAAWDILKDKDKTPEYVGVDPDSANGRVPLEAWRFAGWGSVKIGTYKSDKTSVQTQTAETTIPLIMAKVTG